MPERKRNAVRGSSSSLAFNFFEIKIRFTLNCRNAVNRKGYWNKASHFKLRNHQLQKWPRIRYYSLRNIRNLENSKMSSQVKYGSEAAYQTLSLVFNQRVSNVVASILVTYHIIHTVLIWWFPSRFMIAVNECDSKHRGSKPRCHGSYKTQISFSVTLSAWLLVLNEHKAERLNCLLSHLEASHNIYI